MSKTDHSKAPAAALSKYKCAFQRHEEERFHQHTESVRGGKRKTNATQMYRHEVMQEYRKDLSNVDSFLESQWKMLLDNCRNSSCLNDTLVLVDVSASMMLEGRPKPLYVSVSLGTLLAMCCSSPVFQDKVTCFSRQASLNCAQ